MSVLALCACTAVFMTSAAHAASTQNTVDVSVTIETPTLGGTTGGTTGGGATGGGTTEGTSGGLRPPSIEERIRNYPPYDTPPARPAAPGEPLPPVTITDYNPVSPPLVFEPQPRPGIPSQPGVRPQTPGGPYDCPVVGGHCAATDGPVCEEVSLQCFAGAIASDVGAFAGRIIAQYPTLETIRDAHPVELGMWLFVLIILGFMIRTTLLAFLSLFDKDKRAAAPVSPAPSA